MADVRPVPVAVAAFAIAACGGDDDRDERSESKGTGSLLYVSNAGGGTFEKAAGGGYRLTLTGVDPDVLYVSDRPRRQSGVTTVEAMATGLFAGSDKPPNAAIELLDSGGKQDTFAVELNRPRYDRKRATVTYDAKPLEDLSEGLSHYDDRLNRRLPTRFGRSAMFIDSGGNSCYARIQNSTDYPLQIEASSKKEQDDWEKEPRASMAPNGGSADWWTNGGFARGCWNDVIYTLVVNPSDPNNPVVEIVTNDPYSGSNVYSCEPSDRKRFYCKYSSSESTTHGPILYMVWTLGQN